MDPSPSTTSRSDSPSPHPGGRHRLLHRVSPGAGQAWHFGIPRRWAALFAVLLACTTCNDEPIGVAKPATMAYFFDKTKNVLDQLQLDYSGYEVE